MTAHDTTYFESNPKFGNAGNQLKNTFRFMRLAQDNVKSNYTQFEITNRLENTKPKTK